MNTELLEIINSELYYTTGTYKSVIEILQALEISGFQENYEFAEMLKNGCEIQWYGEGEYAIITFNGKIEAYNLYSAFANEMLGFSFGFNNYYHRDYSDEYIDKQVLEMAQYIKDYETEHLNENQIKYIDDIIEEGKKYFE